MLHCAFPCSQCPCLKKSATILQASQKSVKGPPSKFPNKPLCCEIALNLCFIVFQCLLQCVYRKMNAVSINFLFDNLCNDD